MQDFSESVMVALLPTSSNWCFIKLPHMTLIYAGEIPDLEPSTFNDLGKVALNISLGTGPLTTDVLGVEVLGGEDGMPMVDTLLLRPIPELLIMRTMLEPWNQSAFPFKPHCTIGPMGTAPDKTPDTLTFDRITVKWGREDLTYALSF